MCVGSTAIYLIGIIKVQITSILYRLHNTIEVTHSLWSSDRGGDRDVLCWSLCSCYCCCRSQLVHNFLTILKLTVESRFFGAPDFFKPFIIRSNLLVPLAKESPIYLEPFFFYLGGSRNWESIV